MKFITTLLFVVYLSFSIFSQGNGYLGISMERAQQGGVRISEVLENGSAKVYGLKQNDVILKVNGVEVKTASQLKSQIVNKNWGESINLLLVRDGHTQLKKVTLGNRAEKITYHVKRKKINGGFEWNFDNSTWITMNGDEAKTIVKLDESGVKQVHTITSLESVPQFFSDLEDKLEIVEAINDRNKGKKYFPSITVYIKTYAKVSKVKKTNNPQFNAELKAFPNPSLGEFKFSFQLDNSTDKNLAWEVLDVTGKKVMSKSINNFEGLTTQSINLIQQGAGVYLLRVTSNNSVFTERLVVK